MQLPQWLARFNRHVTNPVQRLWAGWAPGMGILEHVGRKSGKQYRTPLNVFPTDDGVAVLLTYGPDRDWLKNITAAGRARMKRMGRTIELTDPRVVPKAEAATHVTGFWRAVFPRLPFDSAVLLTRG
jgi:deazaflavin-dependent oxidoreductase (nitroreductase family)